VSFSLRRAVLATPAVALVGALSMVGLFGVAFAASDPFVGAWVLDPQRSRYESGDVPAHMVIVMSPTARGIHYRSDTTLGNGTVFHLNTPPTMTVDSRWCWVPRGPGARPAETCR